MRPGLSMTLLPLGIFARLVRLRPRVIITGGFNLWSAVSLLLSALRKIKVIVLYDGSSPHVDLVRRRLRILARQIMARRVDAFVTNSQAGRAYLVNVLKAGQDRVFRRPYLVPSRAALSTAGGGVPRAIAGLRHPVFLHVGRVSHLKGIPFLLEACAILARQGRRDFGLLVVGAGPERKAWQERARNLGLEDVVRWAGWIDYERLGSYLESVDVFVFPTLTDVWGMAVLEAMAFAKPVVCSRYAGASEMVVEAESGFLFDPYRPEQLADVMRRFMDDHGLAASLGRRSAELLRGHDPGAAADRLAEVVRYVTSAAPSSGSSTRSRTPNPPGRSR
jgi:glycosyltransferase involved in cell wall biosynthesis